jgi:hypothetical protein
MVLFKLLLLDNRQVMENKDQGADKDARTPLKLGIAGGASGMIAGLIQLSAGGRLSDITGHKDDPFTLGIITIILSGFSLYCVYHAEKGTSKDLTKRIAPILGISIPAIACFTTVGYLWFLPGPLLFSSAVIYLISLRREIGEGDGWGLPPIPLWRRWVIAIGALLAVSPFLLGWAVDPLSLAVHEADDEKYMVGPVDVVEHEHANGTITRSEVTGVLIVHAGLLLGGGVMLVGGQLGSRPLAIGGGAFSLLILLMFFIMMPTILFNQGAEMDDLSSAHFGALSFGFFLSVTGTLAVIISQFLGEMRSGEVKGEDLD